MPRRRGPATSTSRRAALVALATVAVLHLLYARIACAIPRVADFTGGGSAACVAAMCTTACPCASLLQAIMMLVADNGDEVWLLPPADGSPMPCEQAYTS